MFEQNEYAYIIWQNRAFRFYESARLLYRSEMYSPAAYCAAMCIELILKATLKYWHPQEDPESHGHGIQKLSNTVRNKVPKARSLQVPRYFFEDQRYLSVSRYPTKSKGIGLPASFVQDLDAVFFNVVRLTPIQHNTELVNALSKPRSRRCRNITLGNAEIREARGWLNVKVRPHVPRKPVKSLTEEELAALLLNAE